MPLLNFGCGVRDITPLVPVQLAGFAHRQGLSEGCHSRLFLKAFVFEDRITRRRAAVVAADLLGWDAGLCARIERRCAEQFGTESVILSATHTHSGPTVLSLTGSLSSAPDGRYLDFLAERVVEAVGEACENLQPVEMRRCAVETTGLVVNRRLRTEQGVVARPNEAGLRDQELVVWKFQHPEGEPVAAWIHYACHPTILSGNVISSEYMGSVVQAVENDHPGLVCAFFQGCAGDVRPHFTDGHGNFRRTDLADLNAFVRTMTDQARSAMVCRGIPVTNFEIRTETRTLTTWAGPGKSAGPGSLPISIGLKGLKIARHVGVVAIPGEPSVAYQQFIKAESESGILALGYCNGFPGYLPTAEQIREGGYESVLSCPLFGLPGPFAETLEAGLIQEARALMQEIRR